MQMSVECPDAVFAEVALPSVLTDVGARLEAVEDEPAGPWLAVLLDSIDVTALNEWDMPAYLRASQKLTAWAASLTAEAVAEFASRPSEFGWDKEIALALREPVGAASRRVWIATRLRRLPTLRRLFGQGLVSPKQVEAVVEVTGRVHDGGLLAQVEDKVLTGDGALARTATELRRAARQALTRLDPAGALARAREAREDADVRFEPLDDGIAVTVMEAPVEQALIVKHAADAYTATRKAAGDTRRVGVLRCEGLARICGDYLSGRSTVGGSRPRSGGLPVEIGIVVGLDTALGRRDLPAEVPGVGVVPREVLTAMIAEEGAKLRLLVIDESTGRLLHRAHDGYRPTPAQIAQIRAEYVYSVGPGSQVLAGRTDTDHAIEHPEGPTQIGNLIPNDRTWHNGHTRKQLRVSIDDNGSVLWTSVLGQTRTVNPYDYRLEPPADTPVETTAEPPPEAEPPPF